MRKIGVLILNYKNYEDTQGCVNSVFESDLPSHSKVFVLDNSQNPKRLGEFERKNPKVMVVDNQGNLGFAGGNNPGIKRAMEEGMEAVLVLNPDVRLDKKFFGPILHKLQGKIGLVAPALRHKQKNHEVFGLEGSIDMSLMKASHRNVASLKGEVASSVEFVTFACVMVGREVFERIGFLDERFFMYLEDVDFCLRARKAGFEIILVPEVVCTHRTSGSFDDPRKKLPISFVSQIKFCDKYLLGWRRIRAITYYCLLYPYLYLLWSWHRLKYRSGV